MMDTTTTQDTALTAEVVKAIREARCMVPFYRPNGSEGPTWGFRFSTEVNFTDPIAEQRLARFAKSTVWTRDYASEHKVEYTFTIPANEAHCSIERYEGARRTDHVTEAIAVIHPIFNPPVITALKAIRAGDSLALHFVGGNHGKSLGEAGLVYDEFYLRIIRKRALAGEFLLATYIGPDAARFVR